MGILQRFGDIMRANINELVSDAESKNAEKLLKQYLRDAKENYKEAKSETSMVMAEEMAASRRYNAVLDQMARYDRYAQLAVSAGNDTDALRFLEAKNQLTPKKHEAEADLQQAKQNAEQMRKMTKKLLDDMQAAEAKMVELRSKLRVAESKEKMQELQEKLSAGNSPDGFESLTDAIQKRIDAVDAKAVLHEELRGDTSIADLERRYDSGADEASAAAQAELAALKVQMGLPVQSEAEESDVSTKAEDELAAMKAEMGLSGAPASVPANVSATAKEPVAAEEPAVAKEQPTAVEKPVVAEEPAAADVLTATEEPVTAEQPAVTEESTAAEPAGTEEPVGQNA